MLRAQVNLMLQKAIKVLAQVNHQATNHKSQNSDVVRTFIQGA